MAKYEITGPDGKRYEVNAPHGASEDDAINYVKSNFYSAESKQDPFVETAQKQSALDNLLAGVGGGMTSLYLGGKQMLGKATPEEIAEHKQAMAGLRSTTSGTIGDITGQIAAAVPAAFIPGANTYAGSAAIGAGMGALQPVDEQESRATNMVVGGLGGVAGKYIGDAIGGLISKVTARNHAPMAARSTIEAELKSQGIDFSKLSKETQESLLNDVTESLKGGGKLDPEALARKVDFELTGVKPTQGQLTRDPMQYQFEQNTRGIVGSGESLSQRFNEQNKDLIDAVNRTRAATGGTGADRFGAGESAINTLKSADAARKSNVGNLYDTARNAAGIDTRLNNGRFAQSLNDSLDQQMLGDALPAGIRKAINRIATGEMPFTVQKAEQIRQAINSQMPQIPDRSSVAMRMVNDALQGEIDDLGSTLGGQAGEAFKAARAAAAQRFTELDKSPALKAAVDGFEPDDFVNKFVIRAKPGDLMALRANVEGKPELWNELRGQVIDFIKSKAVSGQSDEFAKFSQSGYKRALNSLGDARLKILFNPDEIAELNRIHRVAASIQVQPVGSAVNNSNTSQAAANLLTRLSNVPYLKEMAINPIVNYRMQGKIDTALNPTIPATATPTVKQVDPAILKLLPLTGSALGANLQNY